MAKQLKQNIEMTSFWKAGYTYDFLILYEPKIFFAGKNN